jgi:hypothetical protein
MDTPQHAQFHSEKILSQLRSQVERMQKTVVRVRAWFRLRRHRNALRSDGTNPPAYCLGERTCKVSSVVFADSVTAGTSFSSGLNVTGTLT